MRFMMLMYPGPGAERGEMPELSEFEAMMAFNEELSKAGVLLALDGLQPTAKGTRVRYPDGKAVAVDGPFTESKEILGGYWMIQVTSKEEAVAWALKVPVCDTSFVEVRQVFEMTDFPEEVQEAVENSKVAEGLKR